ncbi:MAG: hotdog fold thioesterase [Alphaproteobacteria bacterium]|nr:hotdog fold thioesterase [Alphaproteobacteria bacterium]
MSIWFKLSDSALAELKAHGRNTMLAHLGVEFLEVGPDFLTGRLPVDARTHQPLGMLHGGATAMLAETLASEAATMTIDQSRQRTLGLELNINHIRSKREGWVTGTAKPIHLGRSTQVWEVRVVDERNKLVAIARVTMAVQNAPTVMKNG